MQVDWLLAGTWCFEAPELLRAAALPADERFAAAKAANTPAVRVAWLLWVSASSRVELSRGGQGGLAAAASAGTAMPPVVPGRLGACCPWPTQAVAAC